VKGFEGDYYAGKRHGSGRLYLEGGDIYEGTFVGGAREGQGTLRYVDGSVYVGQWFRDVRAGTGTLLLPSGDRYSGAWAGDKKNGRGTFVYKGRGRMYVGEWVDDVAKCGEMVEYAGDEGGSTADLGASASPLAAAAAAAAAAGSGGVGGTSTTSMFAAFTGASGVFGARPPGGTPLPLLGLADPRAVLRAAADDAAAFAMSGGGTGGSGAGGGGAYGPDATSVGGRGSAASGVADGEEHGGAALSELYAVDPAALDLSADELAQLTAAFRVGDAAATGAMPADMHLLMEVLAALGIGATVEDAIALLRELVAQEGDFEAERAAAGLHDALPGGGGDVISFPVFAACMARLRE